MHRHCNYQRIYLKSDIKTEILSVYSYFEIGDIESREYCIRSKKEIVKLMDIREGYCSGTESGHSACLHSLMVGYVIAYNSW